jgi:chlorobactene glucosyltransferase
MTAFLIVLQSLILAFLLAFLLITISNLRVMRRLGSYTLPTATPRVSVLVPARNEEKNIRACVTDLLGQDYPNFELVVLDDNSTDGTSEILAGLARGDSRLRIIRGRPITDNWSGKNWACHQLAQAAAGELLLFTDADTRHHPSCLSDAVAAMLAEQADFISVLPGEEVVTWSEKAAVPFFTSFSFFSVFPLFLGQHRNVVPFAVANGQFLFFRRACYDTIGGFAAIAANAVDDTVMARRVASRGLRWRYLNGADRLSCRMYRNFREVVEGYSKNVFAYLDYRLALFLFVWVWLAVLLWEPWLLLIRAGTGHVASLPVVALAVAAVAVTYAHWALLYRHFRLSIALAALYPLILILLELIAWRSLLLTLFGRTIWKGRRVVKYRIRLV